MQDERSFFDHVLSTTRSVRWRLDLDRPVERESVVECIRLATSHLLAEREVAERLGVPSDYTQVALIPVAHVEGGGLSPPPRRPVEEVIGWNTW